MKCILLLAAFLGITSNAFATRSRSLGLLGGIRWHVRRLIPASNGLQVVVPVALVLIVGLLFVSFGNVKDARWVFTGVPLALTACVAALWVRDMPLYLGRHRLNRARWHLTYTTPPRGFRGGGSSRCAHLSCGP